MYRREVGPRVTGTFTAVGAREHVGYDGNLVVTREVHANGALSPRAGEMPPRSALPPPRWLLADIRRKSVRPFVQRIAYPERLTLQALSCGAEPTPTALAQNSQI